MRQGGGIVRRGHRFEKPPGSEGEEETGEVKDGGEGRFHGVVGNSKKRRGASLCWRGQRRMEPKVLEELMDDGGMGGHCGKIMGCLNLP